MKTQNEDTLMKENEQEQRQQPDALSAKFDKTHIARIMASAGLGMVAGMGITYAASHNDARQEDHDPSEDDEAKEPHNDFSAGHGSATNTTTEHVADYQHDASLDSRIAALERQERILQQQEEERQRQEEERQRQEEERQRQEEERQRLERERLQRDQDSFFKNHEVRVLDSVEVPFDDGSTVNLYGATVDGHQAVFMDDGYGHVMYLAVDWNDDGEVNENEVTDISSYHLNSDQLYQYADNHTDDPQVEVLAIEDDRAIDGFQADVSIQSVDDEPVAQVDIHHGQIVVDENSIDDNEVCDGCDVHLTMPTADDMAASGLPSTDMTMNDNMIDGGTDL